MPDARVSWFGRPQPRVNADLRLFCFPFAGGGAPVFHGWPAHLPEDIDLFAAMLPGRSQRFTEPPYERLRPLVEELSSAIAPLLDRPFALFGHSMGGLIAFELTRALTRMGQNPTRLFVSGCVAPHLRFPRGFSGLPDDRFLHAVAALNGMPKHVLADSEFQGLILPALRADFALTETYIHESGLPVPCPIVAYGALEDQLVTWETLEPWDRHTSSTCSVRMIRGDHWLASCQQAILDDLSRELRPMLGSSARMPHAAQPRLIL